MVAYGSIPTTEQNDSDIDNNYEEDYKYLNVLPSHKRKLKMSRFFNKHLSIYWQHKFRHYFKLFVDIAIALLSIVLCIKYRYIPQLFLELGCRMTTRAYGPNRRQILQIIKVVDDDEQVDSDHRVLVFIHGGGWCSGDLWYDSKLI